MYKRQTLTVRNVRLTRTSKISRLTRLQLLHFPKTYGMSCVSSVEIEDVPHKAPCRLHVPNSYGTECARKSNISRLTRPGFCIIRRLTVCRCASSVEIEDVSRKAPCRLHVSELLRYRMCVLRESLRLPAELGSGFCIIEDLRYVCLLYTSPSPRD